MKLLILYHPDSEYSTSVEGYVKEFDAKTTRSVELVSVDTKDGASLASLYDVVDYPAILVTREDGQLVKFWQGSIFPLVDEVVGYLNA